MVFLALTPAGLSEAISLSAGRFPVWCGCESISESEFAVLATKNVTRFVYSLAEPGQAEAIADALATISEHHTGQHVWVENAPAL